MANFSWSEIHFHKIPGPSRTESIAFITVVTICKPSIQFRGFSSCSRTKEPQPLFADVIPPLRVGCRSVGTQIASCLEVAVTDFLWTRQHNSPFLENHSAV